VRIWQLLRDVLLTGAGLFVILSQVFARQPSDVLLVAGLALTVPATAAHAGALLSGHAPGSSSESAPPAPPSPSSASQEASGE
jgi:hypothetical protein